MLVMVAVWFAAQLTACAHEAQQEAKAEPQREKIAAAAGPSIEAKQVAAEEQAPYVTEIQFKKGKKALNAHDRKQIDKVIRDAKTHGEISDIKVVTWADEEYPSVNTKKLSSRQVKLADRRNGEIKSYIQSLDKKAGIQTYNMAERPGALSQLLSTPNSRIKRALEVAGIPNTDSSVKTPAKASKSIVMIILKN
jgi:hypothetical protein